MSLSTVSEEDEWRVFKGVAIMSVFGLFTIGMFVVMSMGIPPEELGDRIKGFLKTSYPPLQAWNGRVKLRLPFNVSFTSKRGLGLKRQPVFPEPFLTAPTVQVLNRRETLRKLQRDVDEKQQALETQTTSYSLQLLVSEDAALALQAHPDLILALQTHPSHLVVLLNSLQTHYQQTGYWDYGGSWAHRALPPHFLGNMTLFKLHARYHAVRLHCTNILTAVKRDLISNQTGGPRSSKDVINHYLKEMEDREDMSDDDKHGGLNEAERATSSSFFRVRAI